MNGTENGQFKIGDLVQIKTTKFACSSVFQQLRNVALIVLDVDSRVIECYVPVGSLAKSSNIYFFADSPCVFFNDDELKKVSLKNNE